MSAALPEPVLYADAPLVRKLGLIDYTEALQAMRQFSAARDAATPDELWLLEHPPVYTLGQGADLSHGPAVPAEAAAAAIPVVRAERGGEVTYHGPGQLIVYTLVDLARRGIRVREFVRLLEQAVIDLLAAHGLDAARKPGAPGVYVGGAKIAALGIRVAKGRAWHGLALNVDMDLTPFRAIDPCGYPGLAVTQASALGVRAGTGELGSELARRLVDLLASQAAEVHA